jgi:pyruvate dehydrogenase E1 component alpha subunit
MMFKEYDPVKDKMFQVMDNDGKIINKKWMPELPEDILLKAYKDMLFARTADLMAVSYQRQGRMYTYPPNYGQEAIAGGIAMVLKENDWLVPAFRELGAWLAKGASLKEIFMYFMGYEEGNVFKNAKNMLPIAVPIASQLAHAAGLGYAIKIRKQKDVVYGIVGDGGTSHGDFHEALNFAAVWEAPVVFIVQNNQFAISVPFKKQTKSINIAVKALAYGMPGIKVDGNDILAMYQALHYASEHARSGKGPVLVEALTYRKGAHTTSDDPSKYRSKEEEELWDKTDPLKRFKKYLISNAIYNDKEEEKQKAQYKKEVDRQFEEAEKHPPYALEDVFAYTYSEMPDILRQQKADYEKFLKWKEARK